MISLSTLTFFRLVILYSDTRIRLTGHNTTFAGRVEVFSHGFWGRVSYSWRSWRKKEAAVVCRQLGFPGVITALSYSAFGEGSGPVLMSGVDCVGTEKTLQQCQYKDWVNSEAYTGTEVGVVCKTHDFQPDVDNIPIRLQGSSVPNAGRIELLYSGVWGVIGTNNWDMNDAMVVCRQLGYQAGAQAIFTSKLYGPFSGPVWLTNLQCTGSESNVMNCARDEIANKTEQLSSRYHYFARVICKDGSMLRDLPIRLQGSSIPNAGRIELLYAGVWGAISRGNWDMNDAMVVCRQLGYQAGAEAALHNSLYGPFSGPVWLTNLQCTGSENNVMDCVRDSIGNRTEQQSSGYFASVICKDGSMPNGMAVRLRGSHLANVSRVEVHYAGKWGSIYPWSWNWNKMDAMIVICRQLGYATASLAGYESACSDIQSWFTNFRCYGNETSLDQCGRDFHTSSSTGCMNVVCTNETDDSGYEIRLQGSPVPHAGRVEVRIKGVWGSITSHWVYFYIDPNEMSRNARIICRQLGFPDFILPSLLSEFGTGTGPQWFSLHDAHCSGNENSILNCSYFTLPELRRYSTDDLGIVCKPDVPQVNNFQVRLVGSKVSYAGTVEVLHYKVWGAILGYNMDIRVGHVICRQLGYSGAEQISQAVEFWPVKGPLWIYSITCNGNEANISQCAFTTFDRVQRRYYYGPRNAGAVICTETHVGVSRDFRVRLAGAPISNAGRVEIFYAGTWGTIHGSNWDINDAHVVCRQLGYSGAISSGRSTQFGFGNGRIWFQSVRCQGNESNFGECSKSIAGYSGHYTLATALCKLKYRSAPFQNCSDVKCANKGTCITSAAGPVCNCTEGFSGLYCESASFDPCKCSPCKYGGQCYSNSSSFLCTCPKGFTGKHCEERILTVVDPCQSRPCANDTSCYHNDTNYFCVPNGEENSSRNSATTPPASDKPAFSTPLTIVIAISASVIIALVAALVCLVWKIRRLTKDQTNQANDPSKVFSNEAFRADSVYELDERPSISHREVDLGLGSADSGGDVVMDSRPVYEVCARPLPPIPPQQKTRDRIPGAAARPANGNNDVTGTEQLAVHYMGLSARNEGSAKTSIPEPNTYMPLSSGRPQPGVYSGLNSSRTKAKGSKPPGNNGKKRRERKELYVNAQK